MTIHLIKPCMAWHKTDLSLLAALILICIGLSNIGNVNQAHADATVTISPPSGPPGSTVTIVGAAFANDRTMAILFDHARLIETRTDVNGTFTVTATIPITATAGNHSITISDIPETLYATFNVTPPTLVVSPNPSVPGAIVTLSGSNFGASKNITIKFDNTDISNIPSNLVSSSSGRFSATINIHSAVSVGTHAISATDGVLTASEILSIPEAAVTLSRTSGPPGAAVTVTGAGFSANSPVTLKFDSKILPSTPTNIITSPSGTFSTTITFPTVALTSTDIISATDASARTASAIINIIVPPAVTLSKPYGIAGGALAISGSNLSPNSPLTIKFDSITVSTLPATVTTNALGSFEATITIPDIASIGSHDILAFDTSGKTASAVIGVTTPGIITISPQTGAPGTEVIITGSNFFNGTTLLIKFNGAGVSSYPPNIVSGVAGRFLAKFHVPADIIQGNYTIYVEDDYGKIGNTTFKVLGEGLYILPSRPSSGAWNTEVIGVGFTPNSRITMSFDGEKVVTNPTKIIATIGGAFTASFSAPGTAANGNHTITAASDDKAVNTTINLKRQYIDDRYGILISAVPQKYDFNLGETVIITGKVLALNNGAPLLLKVLNPNNAACSFQQLYLDHDMNFKAEPVKLAGSLCSVEGEYKITAYYGAGKALTKFSVAGSDHELTGGKAEVINAQKVLKILRYDNKYPIDLEWATNAVLLRNNLNQTISFYLIFAEFDANEITKKLSQVDITLAPFEKNYLIAPYVPQIIDGKPSGYLHVFAWTSLDAPAPLYPGLYIPY